MYPGQCVMLTRRLLPSTPLCGPSFHMKYIHTAGHSTLHPIHLFCLLVIRCHNTFPLAGSLNTLILVIALCLIPISLYLQSAQHPPPSTVMVQDLKKLYPQAQAVKRGPVTVEVPGAQIDGETKVRRNVASKDGLKLKPADGVDTIFDIMRHASAKFGNAKAMGSRHILNTHVENKKVKKMVDGQQQEVDKKWTYFEMSGYKFMSFVEFEKLALNIGSALKHLGLNPKDRLHLFASTSSQWLTMAHGVISQSGAIVTAYDTLGAEGLKHSMLQTHSRFMFTDPALMPTLVEPFKEAKEVEAVIYSTKEKPKQEDIQKFKDAHPHVKVLSFDELVQLGEAHPADPIPPKADDLACIMYTSGSTGTPKGVLIKHSNVVAAGKCVSTSS
jgi:long-chain acyl-CoA synthetase